MSTKTKKQIIQAEVFRDNNKDHLFGYRIFTFESGKSLVFIPGKNFDNENDDDGYCDCLSLADGKNLATDLSYDYYNFEEDDENDNFLKWIKNSFIFKKDNIESKEVVDAIKLLESKGYSVKK